MATCKELELEERRVEQETALFMFKPCSILYFLKHTKYYLDKNLKINFIKGVGWKNEERNIPPCHKRFFEVNSF